MKLMKTFLFFRLTVCLCIFFILKSDPANAQPSIAWQNTIGGNRDEILGATIITPDGGCILAGTSLSDISADKTENNLGSDDYWVVKLNAEGDIEWQNTIGGTLSDKLRAIALTPDGGYILGGSSTSGISADKTEENINEYDYWVIKLNTDGDIEWQKTIGGDKQDYVRSVQATADGGYIIGGNSWSDASGDKSEDSFGQSDYWIVKLNSTGDIEWENTIGANNFDYLENVLQTPDGGYLASGRSLSYLSGDKTESTNGLFDYWILKLDPSGAIEWQNSIGGSENDELRSAVLTEDGNYLIAGYSDSPVSGDKTEDSDYFTDYWIVKLSPTGDIIWQNTIGGNANDYLFSLAIAPDGGYLLGGYSWSDISDEKTEDSRGYSDYWIVKVDAEGEVVWDKTLGGSNYEYLMDIVQSPDGTILAAGYSHSGHTGDKSEGLLGGYDYWIIKFNADSLLCFLTSTITADGSTTFCKPGNVTLNAPVDAAYTYQWKKNGVNIGGATGASFNATKTGNYQVEISNGTCSDISDSLLITAIPKPSAGVNNLDATNDLCFDSAIKLKATPAGSYTYQWRKDGTPIAGATSAIYFATAAANYSVKVTNASGCSKISDTYTIINTCRQMEDEFLVPDLYPNPCNDLAKIYFPSEDNYIVTLRDAAGKLIFSRQYYGLHSTEINMAVYPAGIYIVGIASNDRQKIITLVKAE